MSEHKHPLPKECALPDRREGLIVLVRHKYDMVRHTDVSVGFNFGEGERVNQIVEVFAVQQKTGTDLDALLSDACTGFSIALRTGKVSIVALAERMAENREEGADTGEPASILGSILRAGAAIERDEKSPYIVEYSAEVLELPL